MKRIILSCLLMLPASVAFGEVMVGETAEWLSHDSTLIALATPVEVESFDGPGEVRFTRARFKLEEVLKGAESTGDVVTVYDYSLGKSDTLGLAKAKEDAKRFLIFVTVAKNQHDRIDGKYVLARTGTWKSAWHVGGKVTGLYTPEYKLLTEFDELLKRTRAQIAAEAQFSRVYPRGRVAKKALPVPFDSEAHRTLYGRSACFLWVPDYRKEAEPAADDDARPKALPKTDDFRNAVAEAVEAAVAALEKPQEYKLTGASRIIVKGKWTWRVTFKPSRMLPADPSKEPVGAGGEVFVNVDAGTGKTTVTHGE